MHSIAFLGSGRMFQNNNAADLWQGQVTMSLVFYISIKAAGAADGSQASPTETHCLMSGQHTCGDGQADFFDGSHIVPGATGVKQCFASGQQNSVALHVGFGVHGCEAVTHSLVNGQQI